MLVSLKWWNFLSCNFLFHHSTLAHSFSGIYSLQLFPCFSFLCLLGAFLACCQSFFISVSPPLSVRGKALGSKHAIFGRGPNIFCKNTMEPWINPVKPGLHDLKIFWEYILCHAMAWKYFRSLFGKNFRAHGCGWDPHHPPCFGGSGGGKRGGWGGLMMGGLMMGGLMMREAGRWTGRGVGGC